MSLWMRIKARWIGRNAWCENCRAHPAGEDGFCSIACREDWQTATTM